MNILLSEIVLWLAPILPQEIFMPGSFPQIVQITMSLWDTTADEMANFRDSRGYDVPYTDEQTLNLNEFSSMLVDGGAHWRS